MGPGEYRYIQTSKDGKYIVSHLRNVNSIPFGNKDEDRFNARSKTVKTNLGPGQYECVQFFNNTGFSFNSKYRSNMARSIGKKLKKNFTSFDSIF